MKKALDLNRMPSTTDSGLSRTDGHVPPIEEVEYRKLIESCSAILWVLDARDMNFLYISPDIEALLGYPIDRWYAEPDFWSEHMHPEDRKWAPAYCAEASRRLEAHTFDYRMIAADGRIVWVRDMVNVIAEDGKPAKLIGVILDITHEKQKEAELTASESMFRQLFQCSRAAQLLIDSADGRIIDANSAASRFYGFGIEVLRTIKLHDLNNLSIAESEDILRSARHGERDYFTMQHRLESGELRDVELFFAVIETANGAMLNAIIHDISDRKRLEALQTNQTQILELIARGQTPLDDIFETIINLTESLYPDMRASLLLLKGNTLHHGSAPSLPRSYKEHIEGLEIGPNAGSCGRAAWSGNRSIAADVLEDPAWADFRDLGQKYGFRACWSQPIFDSSGTVIGTFALYHARPGTPTAEHIHLIEQLAHLASLAIERDRNEKALCANEENQRNLIESALEAIIVHDGERIMYANSAATRLLGAESPTHLIGRAPLDLVPTEYRDSADERIRSIQRENATAPLRDAELLRIDGSRIPIQIAGCPINYNGRMAVRIMFQDITERIQAQQEREARAAAEQANTAKTQFLSTMSHELRTPLNAILGFTQLLAMEVNEPDAQEHVHEIKNAGSHLLDLVDDILELSRIDAGQIELAVEPVSPTDITRDCLSLMGRQAREAGIEIVDETNEAANIRIHADPRRCKQALLNYLTNAVKYAPAAQVRITATAKPSGYCRICVIDNGNGLTPLQQQRVFDPFTRLSEHINQQIEGTGIGLTITRKLIELMRGSVGVNSEPGRGSCFWMELPLVTTQARQISNPENLTESTSSQSMTSSALMPTDGSIRKILYIEDNPASLKLVQHSLAPYSELRLYTAMTPASGLAQARREQPDLILLDLNINGMDGYEVLTELQNDPILADKPVVAITAKALPWDIEKGHQAGFDAYLTKPIDVQTLIDTIHAILASPRQENPTSQA